MRKKSSELKQKSTSLWRQGSWSDDPEREPYEWTDIRLLELDRSQIVWYCGVEVHKRNTMLAFYGMLKERPIFGPVENFDNSEIGRQTMVKMALQFEPRRFLMETTGIFHYTIGWTFENTFPKAEVIVMNARLIKKYLSRVRQNDRIDAINLAQLARYEELLQWSYLPSPHHAVLREYVRQRAKAIAEVVRIKNRIRKILDMFGCGWEWDFQTHWHVEMMKKYCHCELTWGQFLTSDRVDAWEKKLKKLREEFMAWGTANPPNEAREQILFLFNQLLVEQSILDAIETTIRNKVGQDPEIQPQLDCILEIPGLGEFGALEVVSEIGTITRFPTAKYLIPYAGIGPSGKTSGIRIRGNSAEQVVERDKPNPYCNPRLKRVLVSAAGVICRLAKYNQESGDQLVQYARTLISKPLSKMKIYFKVAAKLTRSLFYCLSKNVKYEHTRQNNKELQQNVRTSRRKRDTIMKRILQVKAADAWKSVEIITQALLRMGLNQTTIDHLNEQITENIQTTQSIGSKGGP